MARMSRALSEAAMRAKLRLYSQELRKGKITRSQFADATKELLLERAGAKKKKAARKPKRMVRKAKKVVRKPKKMERKKKNSGLAALVKKAKKLPSAPKKAPKIKGEKKKYYN